MHPRRLYERADRAVCLLFPLIDDKLVPPTSELHHLGIAPKQSHETQLDQQDRHRKIALRGREKA